MAYAASRRKPKRRALGLRVNGIERTIPGLLEELRLGKDHAAKYLKGYEDDRERMVGGNGYRIDWSKIEPEPSNAIFEWISLFKPHCVSGNPQVQLKTSRHGITATRIQALQYADNHWSNATSMAALNEELFTDWGLRYCIAHIDLEAKGDLAQIDDPPYWPKVSRLPLRRFCWDPSAISFTSCRWMAHKIIRPRDEVIREALDHPEYGWDLDQLQHFPAKARRNEPEDGMDDIPERDEIAFWEMWLAGPPSGDGAHGTIYTLDEAQFQASSEPDRWLRPPRPFYGPPSGPYELDGLHYVPDQVAPLSTIAATRNQRDYVNDIERSIVRAVEAYKRLILVRAQDPNLPAIIQSGENDHVFNVNVDEVAKNVVSLEVGGLTDQHLAAKADARDTRDRAMAMPDTARGVVTGKATAFENDLANQAAASRMGFGVGKWQRFQARIFKKVTYFFDVHEEVQIELPEQYARDFVDASTGESPRALVIQGGLEQGEDPTEVFESYDLSIQMRSIGMSSEMQRTMQMQVANATLQTVIAGNEIAPFVRWERYVQLQEELGDVANLTELFDFELMRFINAMKLMNPMLAQGPQPIVQPRLGSDTSRLGAGAGAGRTLTVPQFGGGGGQQQGAAQKQLGKPAGAGAPKQPAAAGAGARR